MPNDTITVEQLFKGLKGLEKKLAGTSRQWDPKIMNKNGIFLQIISECKDLREDPKIVLGPSDQIILSKPALLCWGLLYCKGTPEEKAKLFFDLI